MFSAGYPYIFNVPVLRFNKAFSILVLQVYSLHLSPSIELPGIRAVDREATVI